MDEVTKKLENFSDVWNRVTGTLPAPMDAASVLRELIRRKQTAVSLYCHAASKNRSLYSLLRDEEKQLRMLRGEYFLLTGEKCSTKIRDAVTGEWLQNIRSLYLGENACAKYINENLRLFENRDTRQKLLAMAHQDEIHGQKLKELTFAGI